jgi:cytochrome o ubiquinol oxidase subunit 2
MHSPLLRLSKLVRSAFISASCLLVGCIHAGLLDPRGPIGVAERAILLNSTVIMLAVVISVICLTLAMAWWYRSTNARATYDTSFTYSGRVEFVVWSMATHVI